MQASLQRSGRQRARGYAIAALGCVLLAGCDWLGGGGKWDGWVYPDESNLDHSISLNGFDTFEECQEAAISTMRALDDPGSAAYECGRDCRWNSQIETNVCKETRK
jgi:hypothetical protein